MKILHGGTRDGEVISKDYMVDNRWPSVIYRARIISIADAEKLKISDTIHKRFPDDVYEYVNSEYQFRETINY